MALTKIGRLVDKGIVKDQTNLGTQAADTDEYLLYDASADALKSIAASNVTPNETLITGKDEITIGNVSGSDVLLIYDTSAGVLKKITKSAFDALQPAYTSVTPSNLLSGDGTGNYTIVIAGTDFDQTATFKLVTDGGTDIAMDSVTRDSATQLTGTVAKNKANLTNANEPFDIIITNGNGLSSSTAANAINIDAQPAWVTASGSLGGIYDGSRTGVSFTVEATDPESGAITYAHVSGSLPGGLSLNTSTGVISGNADAAGSNTTSNFTIEARDANSNATERDFSIITYAPQVSSFTASGTFTVPTGLTTVNVLVVAGGGGGGGFGAGGGAGGLIYRPGFPITPGTPISVTVGDGGTPNSYFNGVNGQDSVFSTLTSKGGGGGGSRNGGITTGQPGGSGGGSGNAGAGSAIQPTQSGESGNYGFGNAGGNNGTGSSAESGGGGGAAGAAGSNGATRNGGNGGVGKAYTIADGTTSVYYAGGGGGGVHDVLGSIPGPNTRGDGGQGGGGDGSIGASDPQGAGGQPGTANRGGGAGGGTSSNNTPVQSVAGGTGGKGIVIVSY